MTHFYGVNFSRLPQSFRMVSTWFIIVLYGGQNPFILEEYELGCSEGFSGHQEPCEDSTVFRQFI